MELLYRSVAAAPELFDIDSLPQPCRDLVEALTEPEGIEALVIEMPEAA